MSEPNASLELSDCRMGNRGGVGEAWPLCCGAFYGPADLPPSSHSGADAGPRKVHAAPASSTDHMICKSPCILSMRYVAFIEVLWNLIKQQFERIVHKALHRTSIFYLVIAYSGASFRDMNPTRPLLLHPGIAPNIPGLYGRSETTPSGHKVPQ